MIPTTDKENKFYEEQEKCHICQKEFCYDINDKNKFKIYQKVRYHCHYTGKCRGAAHFIIKELVEEFKGEFECLGENT